MAFLTSEMKEALYQGGKRDVLLYSVVVTIGNICTKMLVYI